MSGVQVPTLLETIQTLTDQITTLQFRVQQIQTRLYWLETTIRNSTSTPNPTSIPSTQSATSAVLMIGEPRKKSLN